jgi:hypothetical protein
MFGSRRFKGEFTPFLQFVLTGFHLSACPSGCCSRSDLRLVFLDVWHDDGSIRLRKCVTCQDFLGFNPQERVISFRGFNFA